MKVVRGIFKVIIGILLVVFFVFAIAMTVILLNVDTKNTGLSRFDDTSLVVVKDKIASDNYKKGDLVLVKLVDLEDMKVGDEIFIYKGDAKSGNVIIDVGTVGEVYLDNHAFAYENGATYDIKWVVGKATKVYPGLGTPLSIIQSQWGFLFIILVPCFLIFIYELYAIIVEIKYGKDEQQN